MIQLLKSRNKKIFTKLRLVGKVFGSSWKNAITKFNKSANFKILKLFKAAPAEINAFSLFEVAAHPTNMVVIYWDFGGGFAHHEQN